MSSSLTSVQLATLKAAIAANATLAAALANGNHGVIEVAGNALSTTPGAFIYRPDITVAQLNAGIVWSEFLALSVQAQNTYFALTNGGVVDATVANVRNGFGTVFSAANSPTLTALNAIAQRVPTVFEAVFTTAHVCSVYGHVLTVDDIVASQQ